MLLQSTTMYWYKLFKIILKLDRLLNLLFNCRPNADTVHYNVLKSIIWSYFETRLITLSSFPSSSRCWYSPLQHIEINYLIIYCNSIDCLVVFSVVVQMLIQSTTTYWNQLFEIILRLDWLLYRFFYRRPDADIVHYNELKSIISNYIVTRLIALSSFRLSSRCSCLCRTH